MKRILGALAILLAVVVGLNILEIIVLRPDGRWPAGIRHVMRWIDEGGELLVGLLLLLLVLIIRQTNGFRFERRRKKDD